MKNVFITGVSGYFGAKLVSLFDAKEDIETIVGVDVTPPGFSSKKLHFIRHDVRDDMKTIIGGRHIDWAIHTAFILPPLHDKSFMEDVNINGTRNFLEGCEKAKVKQIVHCSSTTAYGFHQDNPPLLTEESPLRGNDDFTYSKNKRELEFVVREFVEAHPDVMLTIVRLCFVVGPGFDNTLSRYLLKKIVPLPSHTAPFQFIHEDDLAEIIYRLLKEEKGGVFNLAADGTMTFEEMVHILGNWIVRLPVVIMSPMNSLMWMLRLKCITEFPSPGLNLALYPWIASNEKIKRELGYQFKYTTREAFEDFARHARAD